ncbi:MAG: hypothetical protein LBO69_04565 [Ignavibacteria bacterium]|nr:hypothetical protein [Ignavibacteria bacterium]
MFNSPNATRLVSDARTAAKKMFNLNPLCGNTSNQRGVIVSIGILLLLLFANAQTTAQSGVST